MEIIDAQIIFHPHEVLPSVEMDEADRDVAALESAVIAMESVGVDKALFHDELSLCELAIRTYPERFRGIPSFPDPSGDARESLERVKAIPGMVGFRLTPGWPASGENLERLRNGDYEPWLQAGEELGLVLSVMMLNGLTEVPRIAETYPRLKILIDHLGMIPNPYFPIFPERLEPLPDLLALARYENVAVKFTGVASLSYEPYPFADLWPMSHQIFDTFGLDRVMWGSDFRRIRSILPYRDLLDFLRLTDEVSEADKEILFSKALRNWVGWEQAGV